MSTILRKQQEQILQNLIPNYAVLVLGARRVGKTMLMKEVIKHFSGRALVLNGEDQDTLDMMDRCSIANYRHLLQGYDLLAIDEAQYIPEIGRKLKLIVDEVENIRVLASGSSSFDLLNRAGEPLVGRHTAFLLSPFSASELAQTEDFMQRRQQLETRLVYGSYPDVVLLKRNADREKYLREIVNSYLLRDLLAFDGLKNAQKLRDLLRLIAYQVGSEVSLDELGKTLGLSKNTVEKYLNLLEQAFVIFHMGGYARNLRKEIGKSTKWYFADNGVRNALINAFQPVALRQDMGALWENYFISERRKVNYITQAGRDFYFWRTYDRQEIDLLEECGEELIAFECKWGDKMAPAPKAFRDNYPHATFHVINKDNYWQHLDL